MNIAISLCLGQAQAIRQAVQSWRPSDRSPESLLLTAEAMRDMTVRMGEVAFRVMEEAWEDLRAGRIEDPLIEGAGLWRLLDAVSDALYCLDRHIEALRGAGLEAPDMSVLTRTRAELARLVEAFRDSWPTGGGDDLGSCGADEEEVGAELAYDLGGSD